MRHRDTTVRYRLFTLTERLIEGDVASQAILKQSVNSLNDHPEVISEILWSVYISQARTRGDVTSNAILKTRRAQTLRITLKATEQTLCVNRRYWVVSRKTVKFALKIFFAFCTNLRQYWRIKHWPCTCN